MKEYECVAAGRCVNEVNFHTFVVCVVTYKDSHIFFCIIESYSVLLCHCGSESVLNVLDLWKSEC